jgi:hypothetical protein
MRVVDGTYTKSLIIEAGQVIGEVRAFARAGPDRVTKGVGIFAFRADVVPALCAGVHGGCCGDACGVCESFLRHDTSGHCEDDEEKP